MSLQYIRLEGNLFTSDHLARVQAGDPDLPGLTRQDYEVKRRLDDEVSEAYNKLEAAWGFFKLRKRIESNDPFDVTHDWVSDIWKALGGGPLLKRAAPQIEGKEYPVLFEWEGVPIHVVAHDQDLEKGPRGDARGNPHSTLQEYINRRDDAIWGILTNGLTLRILRDNANSTRPAFIEFDLKGMMEAQSFAEFGLFWRTCHYTRFLKGPDCWLEKWMKESANRGTPARDLLRGAVENALLTLGRGFIRHPKNKALRHRLQQGELTADEYYRQLLRLAYRLIFLFVTEDRGLLLQPDAPKEAKERYATHYSTQRLRKLSHGFRGTRHHDLYESVKVVMDGLKDAKGKPALALPPLNSDLWSRGFIPDLDPPSSEAETGYLENRDLLSAVHDLSRIRLEGGDYRTVDYRNLGAEELGSIYESLLELEARVDVEGRGFRLVSEGGGERKTTGSHYTPQALIDEVLDHALEPLLDESEKAEKPDEAILALTICDPTCGSGHFLIAAAHRTAKRLAKLRTGDPEPAPGDLRRALRDVISRCIYGVDINPMSVELCKVSLWLEAMEPGKPLAYLEHHIKTGNALLGAVPELLEGGIPEQAYEPRDEIDDKKTCRQLVKLNEEFPMNARTLEGFRLDKRRVQDILAQALEHIEVMPTTTVAEVDAKDTEYRRFFLGTDEYERYKFAQDAWCAAFTYRKRPPINGQHLTNVQLVDLLHPEGVTPNETIALIAGEAESASNRFFHWQLEFPSVFRAGGFDAVIGNPPYLGGTLIPGTLGNHYVSFFTALYPNYKPRADLAAAFVNRFWSLRRPTGRVGVVTTNTIWKGDTRLASLARLVKGGAKIVAAQPDMSWTGDASVVVAVVVLGSTDSKARLRGQVVDRISSRFDTGPESEPVALPSRQDMVFEGDKVQGIGFVITHEQAEAWISRDSKARTILLPYLGGEDLFQDEEQKPSRHVICFHQWSIEEAAAFPAILEYVRANVKPHRDTVNRKAHREKWWQFGDYRTGLREASRGLDSVLVRPRVSETPLFVRCDPSWSFSDSLTVVASDSWELTGALNSSIHEVWYRKQGSGMKHDSRYTPSSCFETYPVPNSSEEVAQLGKGFHEACINTARDRGVGLTPLWNFVNSPDCADLDIERIRSLRNRLTEAVGQSYGMTIDFRFGHYKDHADRWRYTMHPEAAEQVYLRLVELNAEQAANVSSARVDTTRLAKGQARLIGGQSRLPLGEP